MGVTDMFLGLQNDAPRSGFFLPMPEERRQAPAAKRVFGDRRATRHSSRTYWLRNPMCDTKPDRNSRSVDAVIIPNLLVTDMQTSIAFYRDALDMKLVMAVDRDRQMFGEGDDASGAVFAILEWNGGQLMLQTAESLSAELQVFEAQQKPAASGTIYFRDLHPKDVLARVSESQVIKGPTLQWYGMMELYLQDPDGYVVCVGAPEGPPPA